MGPASAGRTWRRGLAALELTPAGPGQEDASARAEPAPNGAGRVVLARSDGTRIALSLAAILGLFLLLAPVPFWSHGSIYAFVFQSLWGFGWVFLMLLILPFAGLALALTGLNALRAGMAGIYVEGGEIVFNTTIPLRMALADVASVDMAPRNRRLLLVSSRAGRQWRLGTMLFRAVGEATVEAIRREARRAADPS